MKLIGQSGKVCESEFLLCIYVTFFAFFIFTPQIASRLRYSHIPSRCSKKSTLSLPLKASRPAKAQVALTAIP